MVPHNRISESLNRLRIPEIIREFNSMKSCKLELNSSGERLAISLLNEKKPIID